MNTEQFRQSLKLKWLKYYRDNRAWLEQLGVWVSYEGQRRPSSSFILATVSVLEPRLCQMMPIVVGLSSNPDRVVKAMGLNFSPDEELEKAIASGLLSESSQSEDIKLLPPGRMAMNPAMSPVVDIEHSTGASSGDASTAATNPPVDAVDLYLDQNLDQRRSPHQVAADRDAACHGVGGRELRHAPERGRTQEAASSPAQETASQETQETATRPLATPLPKDAQKVTQKVAQSDESGGEAPQLSEESQSPEMTPQLENPQLEKLEKSEAIHAPHRLANAASFGQRFSSHSSSEAFDESSESPSSSTNSSSEFQSSKAYSF